MFCLALCGMTAYWSGVPLRAELILILKPLVTDYAGAGELINLVPTVLDFWPDLALSSFSCMDLIQNLVLTSWYVGTCYTTPATDTGNFGYGQKKPSVDIWSWGSLNAQHLLCVLKLKILENQKLWKLMIVEQKSIEVNHGYSKLYWS